MIADFTFTIDGARASAFKVGPGQYQVAFGNFCVEASALVGSAAEAFKAALDEHLSVGSCVFDYRGKTYRVQEQAGYAWVDVLRMHLRRKNGWRTTYWARVPSGPLQVKILEHWMDNYADD